MNQLKQQSFSTRISFNQISTFDERKFLQIQSTLQNKSNPIIQSIMTQQTLSPPMTVIGMINGMIGGLILILPVISINAGWMFTLMVILITGAFSYYSCYLCVIHLGDQKDLDYAMFVHFNKSKFIKIIYDITVFSNLLLLGFLYFQLICIQWNGIISHQHIAIPLANAAILLVFIFVLKYFEFGASIMAYGIISIIGYVIFLVWVMVTAPKEEDDWNAQGSGEINLAAAMGGAFAIQSFFIPILKKNPNAKKYNLYTLLAYVAGASIYIYIAYLGAFGILNRTAIVSHPKTIEQYFQKGELVVKIIEGIYLIHLYSVFPQFTLISKTRLFSIFNVKETQKGQISIPEITYAVVFVGLCLMIQLFDVDINEIVGLNGSVIGFFFIYFLPSILHIRCLYFATNKKQGGPQQIMQQSALQLPQQSVQQIPKQTMQQIRQQSVQQITQSTNQQIPLSILKIPGSSVKQGSQQTPQAENTEQQPFFYVCNCKRPQSKIREGLQLLLVAGMIGIGGFIMVNGLMTA